MSLSKNKIRQKLRAEIDARMQDIQGFNAELNRAEDRTSAIIGATMLDEQLRHLLLAFMVDNPTKGNQLVEPDQPRKFRSAY